MSCIRVANKADDSILKLLLKENPMDSWVTVSMEREPSYFNAASLMGESYTLLSEEGNEIVGMFSCTYFPVHIDGKAEMIGYLGELRVREQFRHKIRYIKEGFQAIDKLVPKLATVPYYFTSIASENSRAKRLLEANLKGMPTYVPRGEISTLIFSTRQGRNRGLLCQAEREDIPDIVAFYNKQAAKYQFSPFLSGEWIENLNADAIGLTINDFWLRRGKNGKVEGCLALWDQRTMKQSVIQNYKTPLKHLRWLYNLYANFGKRVKLPACGKALEHLFVAFYAFEDESIGFVAVEEALYLAQKHKKVTSCVLGISSRHPLLHQLKQKLNPSVFLTEIETVTLNNEIQIADFGERLIQPEVALL